MTTREDILAAVAEEMARRKKHWIGGVPTPGDLTGVERQVGYRLKITWDEVKAALAGEEA
jgi:hypothetical protein